MLLSTWYGLSWLFRRDIPKSRIFLWFATCAGVASILALEAGWVVTEVGRQPWIVRNQFRVSEAATTNEGVWATFLTVLVIYIGLGITTVLVLRRMSARDREHDGAGRRHRRAVRTPPDPSPTSTSRPTTTRCRRSD